MAKAGIVGIGAVGTKVAMAMVLGRQVRELVLVNRNRAVAAGVAADLRYGAALSSAIEVTDGDYGDLAGAGVVIVTAGVNEKSGAATDRNDPAGRLRLLAPNARVYHEIIPQIVKAAPEAVILVVTDPPEPLTDVARTLAGHQRVMGTGTYLDSLRFRVHLASRLQISAGSVDAYVIGEHGTSSVFLWSSVHVGGVNLKDVLAQRSIEFNSFRKSVEREVRYANISIIERIGASQYGIGIVTARITQAMLANEHAVIPVGSFDPLRGLTLSLPSVVGRTGVEQVLIPTMSDEEAQSLERSIEALRAAAPQPLVPV